uniref:Lipoprotein n=1 Tax=Rhodopseudomonas palustris (strain BisA53) TaxID=316055 RepID=Q07LG2_RHOP5
MIRIVRSNFAPRRVVLLLGLVAPLLAGCAGADIFSSDLLSRDAEWFSRSGRSFIKNVSIDTPPLMPDKPVLADDLIRADGMCPGMTPPSVDATALSDTNASAQPVSTGVVALGHTECDVARGVGVPENVNLSTNPRGDRVATLTYTRGPRAGIYTFTAGRLSSIERAPEPAAAPKAAKPRKRAAT